MILAHQWQSQLAKVDEEILSAVRSGTNIKIVFRVKDHMEAMDLAEMVIPLNLEMPVELLIKETVVGYEARRMNNASSWALQSYSPQNDEAANMRRPLPSSLQDHDSNRHMITVPNTLCHQRQSPMGPQFSLATIESKASP